MRYYPLLFLIFIISDISAQIDIFRRDPSEWCANCAENNLPLNKENSIKSSTYTNYQKITPLVVKKDNSFTIEIGINDILIANVRLKNLTIYKSVPLSAEWIKLYDDGTNGDKVPGDNIFTYDKFFAGWTSDSAPIVNWSLSLTTFEFGFTNGSTIQIEEPIKPVLRMIDPYQVPIPTIQQVNNFCQTSPRVVNIISENILGEYPSAKIFFGNSQEYFRDVMTEYYKLFPSDRDFVIINNLIGGKEGSNASGSYRTIKNETSGIGRGIYDYSNYYGTNGKLIGAVFIWNGSSNGFSIYKHELLHQWALFIDESIGLNNGSHWIQPLVGFKSSGFSSYYTRWTNIIHQYNDIYKATYETSIFSNDFNDFELYLMGLLNSDKVTTTLQTLENPIQVEINYVGEYALYQANGIKNVDINNIINVHGERNPSYLESQKEFYVAQIVPYDRFLTLDEMAYFEYVMEEFEKQNSPMGTTFQESTQNLASISGLLSPALSTKESEGNTSQKMHLYQNFPNPFNSTTAIYYNLNQDTNIKIEIYDLLGKLIKSIRNEYQSQGEYSISWDGTDNSGANVSGGIYFYKLQAGDFTQTRKMVLLK